MDERKFCIGDRVRLESPWGPDDPNEGKEGNRCWVYRRYRLSSSAALRWVHMEQARISPDRAPV